MSSHLNPYLIKLGKYLTHAVMQDADFEMLITNSTVLSRNQVCCVSENHIDRVFRELIPALSGSRGCTQSSLLAERGGLIQ